MPGRSNKAEHPTWQSEKTNETGCGCEYRLRECPQRRRLKAGRRTNKDEGRKTKAREYRIIQNTVGETLRPACSRRACKLWGTTDLRRSLSVSRSCLSMSWVCRRRAAIGSFCFAMMGSFATICLAFFAVASCLRPRRKRTRFRRHRRRRGLRPYKLSYQTTSADIQFIKSVANARSMLKYRARSQKRGRPTPVPRWLPIIFPSTSSPSIS